MGIREFIEKIINSFKKTETKLLTGEIETGTNSAQAFRMRNREQVAIDEDMNKETIEEIILEYIFQYQKQIQMGTVKDVSYRAFTRMFYEGQEEVGGNLENQNKLKQKIHKVSKYRVDGQYSSDGTPIFYHISQNTPEGQRITDKDEKIYKIYLNCERKDISRLAGEILKKLDKIDDCAFRMKFIAESQMSEKSKRYQRNDKIVIYTAKEIDKERIIASLIELKRNKPELFSSRKKLPLMPKINGFIGCINQGRNIVTTPLYESKYADTYNSKLATIMEDCMISSIREISARDAKLVYAMDGYYGENPNEYLRTFKIMNPEQVHQVVDMFKTQLVDCCEKSNIKIDMDKETPDQQK